IAMKRLVAHKLRSAVNCSSGFRRGYSRLARVFSPTVYASTSAARNAWVPHSDNATHLGVGRTVFPRAGVPELARIRRGVRHIDVEPIDSQQPPPPQPRTPGEHRRHRLDHTLEHLGHNVAAQPFTGLGDPTGGRHRPRSIPAPPPIQRPSDLRGDLFV